MLRRHVLRDLVLGVFWIVLGTVALVALYDRRPEVPTLSPAGAATVTTSPPRPPTTCDTVRPAAI